MRKLIRAVVTGVAMVLFAGSAGAQAPPGMGTEEFGLTPRQLVKSIERVEALISKCIREHGFQYVAADYITVRKGMGADKNMPGLSEEEFIGKHGFGVSTMYTGQPPQLATGYSPAKVGLGERNVQIYKNLSPADQVAYNRALFGENTDATLAVGLETENFSRTGGAPDAPTKVPGVDERTSSVREDERVIVEEVGSPMGENGRDPTGQLDRRLPARLRRSQKPTA